MMDDDIDDILTKQILSKLEAYGDSVIENEDFTQMKRKKPKKQKIYTSDAEQRLDKRRKKKRKKTNPSEITDASKTKNSVTEEQQLKGKDKHIREMKEKLGLLGSNNQSDLADNVETNDSKACSKSKSVVVVYEAPKSKKKKLEDGRESHSVSDLSNPIVDMESARFEVRKFGIKGLDDAKNKKAAMTALLMELGAKAPKKKGYNYKEYQEMVRKQKQAEIEKRELDRKLGYKIPKRRKEQKKDRNDIGHVDGLGGKYKSGVLFVSKKDMQPGGGAHKRRRRKYR